VSDSLLSDHHPDRHSRALNTPQATVGDHEAQTYHEADAHREADVHREGEAYRKGEAYRDDGTLPRPNPITRYAETLTLARAIQQ
jgi:hypothetical protein